MPTPPPPPRRLLGLDPGTRRTGVAIADELGLFAHARPAILGTDLARVTDEVSRIVTAEGVGEVVVGLPLSLSGNETDQTRHARSFAAQLRRLLAVPVTEWDERLSSVEAGRQVRGANRRKTGELDSAAAAVVLQAVLDARRARPA